MREAMNRIHCKHEIESWAIEYTLAELHMKIDGLSWAWSLYKFTAVGLDRLDLLSGDEAI